METRFQKASPLIAEMGKFPLLEPEQEARLTRQWQIDRDQRALRLLTGSHLRLVVKLAVRYRGYGMPFDELVAAGNIGLVQAADKFDPDRGNRFSTYASWWIRSAMQEYVIRNWSLVKAATTGNRRQLFFNLRRLKREHGELGSGELPPQVVADIAAELGTSESDVAEMNRYLSGTDVSLNTPVGEDFGDEWCDFLPDESPNQETAIAESDERRKRQALVDEAMQTLNARERHILAERRLREEPLTLDELSQHYGISRERVRQIEVRALEKLQKAVIRAAKTSDLQTPLAAAA
jgi:RNA polymerase sigma-32 factor